MRSQAGSMGVCAALIVFLGATDASPQTHPAANDSTAAIGRESPWPLTIKTNDTTLTVYQPQLDIWDGHTLVGRVAVRAGADPQAPSTYGIVTLSARTLTDKGTRVV